MDLIFSLFFLFTLAVEFNIWRDFLKSNLISVPMFSLLRNSWIHFWIYRGQVNTHLITKETVKQKLTCHSEITNSTITRTCNCSANPDQPICQCNLIRAYQLYVYKAIAFQKQHICWSDCTDMLGYSGLTTNRSKHANLFGSLFEESKLTSEMQRNTAYPWLLLFKAITDNLHSKKI